jgi:hypothetical protein
MLGFNEITDTFNFDIRDFGTLNSGMINFLANTSLPTPTSTYNLGDVDFGNSTIKGDTIPTNWSSIMLRPTRVEITQIPEVGAMSLVLLSLSTLVFTRERFVP